jgi:predicted RecB family nuclease
MRVIASHLRLSPTDLANFLQCRHRTGLDLAAAHHELTRPQWTDPFVDALRARGEEHERRFVDSLRAEGLEVVDLRDQDEAAARTMECLHAGIDVIVQARLESGNWMGYADVLRRVPRPSALGTWSYEVYDTKLARATRGATILQLCAYSQLLADLQGVTPEHVFVVTPDPVAPIHQYRVEDYAAYFRLIRKRFLETLRLGHEEIRARHYPEPVDVCDMCQWFARCRARRRADDHLSFVAGMSRLHRTELVASGFETLTKTAAMPLPVPFNPSRGARPTFERLREQARVQHEQRTRGRPVYEFLGVEPHKGFGKLPEPSAGDLFLDLEGDPFAREGGREYLFGLSLAPLSTHQCWWAVDDIQERAAFEAVMDVIAERVAAYPDMHVYHFGHYEPAAFKRLMGRYATRADVLDRLLRGGRFVDLHSVVRGALRAGVESYSIKKLEPFYTFTRDIGLEEAGVHLRAVELALESHAPEVISAADRGAVEGYNRDDRRSTVALRDWLEQLRRELADTIELPRPKVEEDKPSDRVRALDTEVETLRARLLEGVPFERQEQTEQQHVRWLLAYLIDWHRREEKADWWEFFRLCELEEDELLEEPKAITGLALVGRVGVVRHKTSGKPTGSVVDRYTFPAQELDVSAGNRLKVRSTESWGTVEDIDLDARTIDVKKGPDRADEHPKHAFVESVFGTETVQRSVMRLAEALLGGARNAATDLLFRRRPRLRTGEFAAADGESAVEFAVRIAPQLDRTTLAIQGPPGAGKTSAGAKMICALVNAGLRVGVTAVSHKVIRNLLDATTAQAAKAGMRVRAAHKVSEEKHPSPAVVEITDNGEALGQLAAGDIDVLGGTSWLWSRPDAREAVDVLFVDEAGQMSLANVLAVAPSAGSVVLLGDPQQLDQPASASHPDGVGVSALHHVLADALTMPPDRGLFLPNTWRLAPAICRFTSETFYEGKLQWKPGLEHQRLAGTGLFDGAGLWWVPAAHESNQSYSPEEVEIVAHVIDLLLAPGAHWVDENGVTHALTGGDLRVVTPYNAQVNRLADRLAGRGVPVGTVDKFQGQEGPIVIYSMATSRPEDAPRGMEFLFSLNRLNVATSRARCAAILVASTRLFEPECRTPRRMQLANALCRYREMATECVPFG